MWVKLDYFNDYNYFNFNGHRCHHNHHSLNCDGPSSRNRNYAIGGSNCHLDLSTIYITRNFLWFVRWGNAWSFISLTQQFLNRLLINQPDFIQFLRHGLQLTTSQTLLLPLILLGFGSTVGLMGSLFAVRTVGIRPSGSADPGRRTRGRSRIPR